MCRTNSTCLILDSIMSFNPVLLYFTAGNIRYNWYVVLYGLQQSSCKIIGERTHTKSEFLGLSDFQILHLFVTTVEWSFMLMHLLSVEG